MYKRMLNEPVPKFQPSASHIQADIGGLHSKQCAMHSQRPYPETLVDRTVTEDCNESNKHPLVGYDPRYGNISQQSSTALHSLNATSTQSRMMTPELSRLMSISARKHAN